MLKVKGTSSLEAKPNNSVELGGIINCVRVVSGLPLEEGIFTSFDAYPAP